MSSSIPNRKPAWAGAEPPARAAFAEAVPESVRAWLAARVLPLFFDGEIDVAGALAPVGASRRGHYRVAGYGGDYVLHIKDAASGDLDQAARIAEFLRERGVTVADYQRARSGRVEETVDGSRITATRYFEARHGNGDVTDAAALGAALGRCHGALAEYPDATAVRERTESVIARLTEIRDMARQAVPAAVPATWRDAARAAACGYDPRFAFAGPAQCVHGDVSPGNVLFSDGGAVLCDFEDAAFGFRPPLFDLAMAALRFGLDGPEAEATARVNALLDSYGGAAPDRDLLRRSMTWSAHHAWMVLTALALDGGAPDAGEWAKPARWLELVERW